MKNNEQEAAIERPWPRTFRHGNWDDYRPVLAALYELAGRGPAVDLGCGEAHTTKAWPECVLVDSVPRKAVADAGRTVEQMDMRLAPVLFAERKQTFNFALMADSIEHLTRADGLKIIADMEPLTKAFAIFTPVGPWCMDERATHPDSHKSAWFPKEFHDKGWAVWEFPIWHNFHPDVLGAFWAWRFKENQPTAAEVARVANIAL